MNHYNAACTFERLLLFVSCLQCHPHNDVSRSLSPAIPLGRIFVTGGEAPDRRSQRRRQRSLPVLVDFTIITGVHIYIIFLPLMGGIKCDWGWIRQLNIVAGYPYVQEEYIRACRSKTVGHGSLTLLSARGCTQRCVGTSTALARLFFLRFF